MIQKAKQTFSMYLLVKTVRQI